jgi:hypothetical protein
LEEGSWKSVPNERNNSLAAHPTPVTTPTLLQWNLTQLTCLSCGIHQLIIEENSVLAEINIYANENLTNIDVSDLPVLTYLDISYCPINQVILPVSQSLDTLICWNSPIDNLDYASQVNLKYFECRNANFSNLNFSSNPKLEYIVASKNPLTTIVLSGNDSLKVLGLSHCDLSTLDASGAPNLEILGCSGNENLTTIKVDNLPKLKTLHVGFNNLKKNRY